MGKTRVCPTLCFAIIQSTLRLPAGHVTCISAAHTCINMTLSSTIKRLDNSHWTYRKQFVVQSKTVCARGLRQFWHTSVYGWLCSMAGSEPLTEKLLTVVNTAMLTATKCVCWGGGGGLGVGGSQYKLQKPGLPEGDPQSGAQDPTMLHMCLSLLVETHSARCHYRRMQLHFWAQSYY
jgi:hypothetical protein